MTSTDLEQRFFHRSTTPRFFQPLNPGFQTNFSIPKAFSSSYLNQKEEDNEEITATLTDSKKEKVWRVKIVRTEEDGKQLKLKQGWEDFCKDHDELGVGDFVVFEHHGSLVFHVSFYGHNGMEKTGYKEHSSDKASFTPTGRPFFDVVLKSYSMKCGLVYIPKVFAMENKLDKRWCGMELMDEEGQTWSMLLRHKKDTGKGAQFYIGGWCPFHKAHDLKTGDHIGFELIHSGKKPLMKFYSNFKGFQGVRGKDCSEQRVSFKPCGFPHCSMVVKPYWKTKGVFFPSAFARENGLINRRCEVETIDEKGRKWSLPLRGQRGNRAYIASFRTFYEANGLEPGDRVSFELVNSGEDIVMMFYTTESID